MDHIIYSGLDNKPRNDSELLGAEIARMAISLGIINPDQHLTGVHLIALCSDIYGVLETNGLMVAQEPSATVEETIEKVVSEQAQQDSTAPNPAQETSREAAATTATSVTPPAATAPRSKGFNFKRPQATTSSAPIDPEPSATTQEQAQPRGNGAATAEAPAETQVAAQEPTYQPEPPKTKFSFGRPRA